MKKTIYYWSPCLTDVGTVKSTINSSLALKKYNSKYEIILLNAFGEWDLYKKKLNEKGITVKNLTFNFKSFLPKYGFINSRFSYILISLISFLPLLILLKKKKPDFIIAHLITSLPIILFNLFSFKTKLILRISGFPKLNFLRRKFWNFSSKKIFKITCPTSELMTEMIKENIFSKNKLSILYDAILNIEDFRTKINDKNFLPPESLPEKFFLSVGRFTKQKNYEYLVKEFKEFCSKYPNEKLLIIGKGELKEKIIKQIEKLNMSQNIFVIDHTANVYYFMKRSKALILSSLWEEVGFVIVEAAMSNAFVISSNCKNGPKEFLMNGNAGNLFENNKEKSLERNLELFINSKENSLLEKKVKAKKNSCKFTMFRHQLELKKLFI